MWKVFLTVLALIGYVAGTAHGAEPRLPPKNCVEDQRLKKEMAEVSRQILISLNDMAPKLSHGPTTLVAIRRQCVEMFGDENKCSQLGVSIEID